MKRSLLVVILTFVFRFTFAQYETGGRESLNAFIDLFLGPVPRWQPKGEGYAFLNSNGLVIKTRERTATVEGAQNEFEWSHDGNSIIYTAKDSTRNLKIFRYFLADGKSKLISLESKWSDFYPKISPDDSIICYYSAKDEPFKIYYLRNEVTRKMTSQDEIEYLHPEWSPQGNYLLYYRHRQPDEATMEVIDFITKKVIFSVDYGRFDFFDWSPDESEILVLEKVTTVNNLNYYEGKLARINIKSKVKITLTESYKDLYAAEWLKNNRIVFNANQNINIIEYDGTNLKKIFSGGNFPNVDSKGEKIVFVRNKKGMPIYEIDLDGKNLNLLESKTFKDFWGPVSD